MPIAECKKILAVVDDLFFTIKIHEAAKRAGLKAEFVKNETDALDRARHERPLLIIVDLNCAGAKPIELVSHLKASEEFKHISVLAYVSHVQGELKQKAQESGCDMVLARSAFSQNLPQILRRHANAA
jgi:CheY-like chemotaxis protein